MKPIVNLNLEKIMKLRMNINDSLERNTKTVFLYILYIVFTKIIMQRKFIIELVPFRTFMRQKQLQPNDLMMDSYLVENSRTIHQTKGEAQNFYHFLEIKEPLLRRNNLCLNSNKFYQLIGCLIVIFCLITPGQSQCTMSPVLETMYLEQNMYCTMKFDPCSDYKLVQCSNIYCLFDDSDCITLVKMKSKQNCQQYCCKSSQATQNLNNYNSLNFCNQNLSSKSEIGSSEGSGQNIPQNNPPPTSSGGYIIIAIFCAVFVGALITVCLCRRYRNRNIDESNPNQSHTVLPPATVVDLKGYNIDAQGPYFVNSNESCAICLDNNVNLRTHCNHFYHGNCLLAWLKKKPNNPCPLCMGTTYNPIKVYCKQCHCGDKLINIQPHTPLKVVQQYDTHKCSNCQNIGNKSFSLVEEQQNNCPKAVSFDKQVMNYSNQLKQKDQLSIKDQNQSPRPKRRHRKFESLKRVSHKSQKDKSEQFQDPISTTNKKLKQDYNKTSIYP